VIYNKGFRTGEDQ